MYQYRIYRSISPNPTDLQGKVSHPDSVFEDRNIQKGVLYYYRITAVDFSLNESPFSEEVSAAIPKIFNFPDIRFIPVDSARIINLNDFVYDPESLTVTCLNRTIKVPDFEGLWSIGERTTVEIAKMRSVMLAEIPQHTTSDLGEMGIVCNDGAF